MKTQTGITASSSKYLMTWIGGKSFLRKKISTFIPADISSYIEPFGGAAWVMFYKEKWANLEVYNDLDSDLYNLFTVVKYHPDELIKEIRFMLNSRELFYHTLAAKPCTDIQRAAKFFYLIQRSYGGKMDSFGTYRNGLKGSGKSHANMVTRISDISKRLDKVVIENMDFAELIQRYDCDSAFFYLDPPYIKGADLYKTVKKEFEHKRLRNCLNSTKGRWLLSYDDEPQIRELYKGFKIIEVNRKCSLGNGKMFNELLISNY